MVLNCSCLRYGPSENAVGTDNIMKHMKDERILIAVYMLVIGCVLIKKESLDCSTQKKAWKQSAQKKLNRPYC
ncbi:MAG: hypothetical protein ACJ0DI_05980 [bacterium]